MLLNLPCDMKRAIDPVAAAHLYPTMFGSHRSRWSSKDRTQQRYNVHDAAPASRSALLPDSEVSLLHAAHLSCRPDPKTQGSTFTSDETLTICQSAYSSRHTSCTTEEELRKGESLCPSLRQDAQLHVHAKSLSDMNENHLVPESQQSSTPIPCQNSRTSRNTHLMVQCLPILENLVRHVLFLLSAQTCVRNPS